MIEASSQDMRAPDLPQSATATHVITNNLEGIELQAPAVAEQVTPRLQTTTSGILTENQANSVPFDPETGMKLSKSRSQLSECRPQKLSTVKESSPELEEASPQIKPLRTYTNFHRDGEGQKKSLKRMTQSVSGQGQPWSFQVKHIVINQEEMPRNEMDLADHKSYSSVSSYGDEAGINRQVQEQFLEQYDKKNGYFFKTMEAQDSNESGEDDRQAKIRAQEVLRLAAESKMRIEQELQNSEKLRQQMESERSFGRKIVSSFLASAFVGTATIIFTKNKRNSILASLATLACSFIIQ